MNKYFHSFVPGFNNWYILAPALIVVAIIIGRMTVKAKLGRRKSVRVLVTSQWTDIAIAAVLAIIVGYFIYEESFAGILQWWDNHTGTQYGDPTGVYSLLLAGMTPPIITMIIGFIYFVVLRIAKTAKLNAYKAGLRELGVPFGVYRIRTVADSAHDLACLIGRVFKKVGDSVEESIDRRLTA